MSELDPAERVGIRGEHVYEHPAFGLIGGSRVSGGTVLFGSDFEHHNFVEIRVARAELHRDLSHDWHFGRDEIVAVRLSEAQWATFVSSLNMGQGVPCTIAYVERQPMPSIPLRREEDAAREDAKEHIREMVGLVDKAIAEASDGVGTGLSKVRRDAILGPLRKLRQEIASNTPYMMHSFEKHFETTVERAKIEVNAYVQNAVMRAGLSKLAEGDALLRLPPTQPSPEQPSEANPTPVKGDSP